MAESPVGTLTAMGFSVALAKRALELEGDDVQRAAEMLLTNPPTLAVDSTVVDLEAEDNVDSQLAMLVDMGYDACTARKALLTAGGDLNAAVEALLANPTSTTSTHQGTTPESLETLSVSEGRAAESVDFPESAPCSKLPSSSSLASASELSRTGLKRSEKVEARASSSRPAKLLKSITGIPRPQSPMANEPVNTYTVAEVASHLAFGDAAFGKLRPNATVPRSSDASAVDVSRVVKPSVPGVERMYGERGLKPVLQMLNDSQHVGLHMHGPASSPVNRQIIPAMRHVLAELSKLPPRHTKRVTCLTALAHACQDCQQVQAREVLRIFGDLTSQNDTFEGQLKYSLVRQKEAALDRYISRRHITCDQDHTQVCPHQQRAHLVSGYVALIGDQFGFDGVTAALSDRFLPQVKKEIGRVKPHALMAELKGDMSPKEWLQTLLADINNQTPGSDRLINPDHIFRWVQANMSEEAAHRVFYDEDRAAEFADLDPKEPLAENKYQPFLSPVVLVEMLVKAGMLQRG